MKKQNLMALLCTLCTVMGTLFFCSPEVTAQSRLRITGTVVGIGGRASGRSAQFTLIVNNYTAPNQVREVNDALKRGGQDELVRTLSGMNAGRIQVGNSVGVPANVIIADPWGEGGTKLTVFYERRLNMYELRYGTRSQDYQIGYAEVFIDRNGKGEGTLIAAARVRLRDNNTWEVEDFGVFPARLMGLRSSGQVSPR